MSHNTFDLTLALAEMVFPDELVRSTFTGASGVDSSLNGIYNDDYFNQGTLWFLDTATGRESSGVAANEYQIITDYAGATAAFTFGGTLVTASGKNYVAAPAQFTLGQMINALNEAVLLCGPIRTVDTTSLDTTAGQTEFTLPFTQGDLREVWIQGQTGDSNDNQWVEARNWYVEKTAAGSADTLLFREEWSSGRDIKLVYTAPHALFTLNIDGTYQNLDESLNFERVVAEAAYALVAGLAFTRRHDQQSVKFQLDLLEAKRDLLRQMYPRRGITRKPNLFYI